MRYTAKSVTNGVAMQSFGKISGIFESVVINTAFLQ